MTSLPSVSFPTELKRSSQANYDVKYQNTVKYAQREDTVRWA